MKAPKKRVPPMNATVTLYDANGCQIGGVTSDVRPNVGDYIDWNGQKYRVLSRWWMFGGTELRIICEALQ